MTCLFVVKSGPQAGKTIWLQDGQTIQIGRTETNDCCIDDDKLLSRLHFAIDCEANELRLRDLGSRNGTFVNGEPVKIARLSHGDRIVAGETEFEISLRAAAPAAAGSPARKSWTKDRLNKKPISEVPQAAEQLAANLSPIVLTPDQQTSMQTFTSGPPSGAVHDRGEEQTMAVPLSSLESTLPRAFSAPRSEIPCFRAPQRLGLRCFSSPQGMARPLDLARALVQRPDFFLLINLMNMEHEARSFFLNPIQGQRFLRIGDALVLISTRDDIDCFELFRRAWGRDGFIGLFSGSPIEKVAETIRNFAHSFMHPSSFRQDIERSPPEGVQLLFSAIDAALLENDAADGWSLLLGPASRLDVSSLGLGIIVPPQ